ncbi:MAG: hypothetical protein CMP59_02965 [Flavobacteriales bacterium]|nr:hypothetical protein [Flavobacteriales bacterium]|tara:strand:- start:777 stop:1328 length:552 start_codon:yes stop_codon:yes gene_type:complete
MKNLSLIFLLFLSHFAFAQEASSNVEKENYKFNEVIEAEFDFNARYDSVHFPDFVDFRRLESSYKTSTVSIKDGRESYITKNTFKLLANEPGKYTIEGPIYFLNGKQYQAEPLKVQVAKQELANGLTPPNKVAHPDHLMEKKGAIRITYYDGKANLEVYDGLFWNFERTLEEDELEFFSELGI